jgi:long-chain acyl-CoA synthetase
MPKLLLRNARQLSSSPAMRHKDRGIWQSWTWAQMRQEVMTLALGFYVLGLKRGERVAIVGSNRPRLYWSMLAAQSLGEDATARQLVEYVYADVDEKLWDAAEKSVRAQLDYLRAP